jgi:hypothetical protein
MNDQKMTKWTKMLDGITKQVLHLMDFRRWNSIYEGVVNTNPALDPNNHVLSYFRYIYKDYAVLAVRRLVRKQKDAVTLTGLLVDLVENHEMFTREWNYAMFSTPVPGFAPYDKTMSDNLADLHWVKHCDGTGQYLDPTKIQADLNALREATVHIVELSDREIAHYDPRDFSPQFDRPTYDSLDAAIVLIEATTLKYRLILTGVSGNTLTPFDTTNSVSVFRIPWVK